MKNFWELTKFGVNKYFRFSYQYILLAIVVTVILVFLEPILAGLLIVTLAFLITYDIRDHESKLSALESEKSKESEEFESVTMHAIFRMPFPLVMTDKSGVITWQNSPFSEIVGEIDRNAKLNELIPAITLSELEKDQKSFNISYKDKYYLVRSDKVFDHGKLDRYIVYMLDVTKNRELEKAYNQDALAVMVVFVDNLDEAKSGGDEALRTKVSSTVDTTIVDYFTSHNAIVRKYDNDKYLVIADRDSLNKIKAKKFNILDTIRELEFENTIPLTLSIGVCDLGENPNEKFVKARSAIDIALGRGGDQAVCVGENGYEYFGGKTKAVQKHTKVKARVIGYALKELIDQADNIYVSGHKNPDMDAIGSAVGIMAIVQLREKNARLILDDDTEAVTSIMDLMKAESKVMYDSIITPDDALKSYKKGDLLILTDHHKPSLSPSKELSEKADNIVIIDHHRRSDEFIDNPALVYLEPHASSASELVAEILQYMIDDKKLSHFESSALMAGIMLDTKNFTTQTGLRTFEAAGLLTRMGADPEEVKLLFRDDFDTFVNKAKAVESVEIYKDHFAISMTKNEGNEAILTAAQASDDLLKIEGVKASFVMAQIDNMVHISARSMGQVSVQLIMEALGGGGHIAQAGARVEGTIDEVKEKIKDAIDQYIKEENDESNTN
ncbi:DHH family phosphoesterase [uncultured Ezakiella sp.]|uniref:DHH family phosphoesterase n=1 Tax=uncultured Ezakiella sp. TaxID=1637529 RepID=UPI0025EEDE76|nr:DHH family phosphoesterase [uncultured Ezakiella sp.]